MEREKDRSESIWEEVSLPKFGSLKENKTVEVCVVGGGMAGVSIAYQLAKRGHKVMILEGSTLGSGQSSRTTAHLSYQMEETLERLVKKHSEEALAEYIQSHKKAIDMVEEIVLQESISCDFKRLPGYLFLGPKDQESILKEEARLGEELGLDLKYIENIPNFPHLGPAVEYPSQAQFHPLKYMASLIRVMKDLGVEIYENSHVREFGAEGDYQLLTTDSDFTIKSTYLVVATDSPVNNRYYIHTKQTAYRTYAVGFSMRHKFEIPLMWDTDSPYRYMRQSGDTFILGGEDHRTGQAPDGDPYEKLIAWARENFSFLGEVQWKWSGQVFEPVDSMAYIGKNPGNEKNVFIVTGQSGLGMTNAAIAAQVIPDLIENRSNYMIDIFDPSRSMIKQAAEFIRDNTIAAFQYKSWLTPAEVKNVEDIPLDHGGLIRDGLSKNCVYHAESEEFETRCAVCPHLGGIVQWNDLEKSWDCPCHGSRFNVHGKVIEGPAISPLAEP